MPLPKITLDRIKADAAMATNKQDERLRNKSNDYGRRISFLDGYEDGYTEGATTENTRAQMLVNVMEATIGILSAFIQPAYFNQQINTEQQILINTRREIENVLEEWKGIITPEQSATLLHPPDDNSPKGMSGPGGEPFKK